MILLRVLFFIVLLAVKAVIPLAPATQVTADEAMSASFAVETEGEDDDSDVMVALPLSCAHVVEKHHPPGREPRRPEDPPPAPADRPPNA